MQLSIRTLACGFASLTLLASAGGAFAADQMGKDNMMAGKKMSAADSATMMRCEKMTKPMMAKDAKCQAFMKAHPMAAKDKMGSDKMGSDKMGADKMGSDKMGSDKMGADKMGKDKMGADPMKP